MIGDGSCNDETNNADCNYDGGDCCGSCVLNNQCTECECLGGDNVINALIGNGFCNDEFNNADCYYDGGDCCEFNTMPWNPKYLKQFWKLKHEMVLVSVNIHTLLVLVLVNA